MLNKSKNYPRVNEDRCGKPVVVRQMMFYCHAGFFHIYTSIRLKEGINYKKIKGNKTHLLYSGKLLFIFFRWLRLAEY